MSTKGRTKFTVAGFHPLLTLIRDRLIGQGYALVPWNERPDFVLFGAKYSPGDDFATRMAELATMTDVIGHNELPVLLLSDSEPCPKSPLRANNERFLIARAAEMLLLRATRTLVVRPHNVYGEDIKEGVVRAFVEAARRGEKLPVFGHMYQRRMFLYQDDFYEAFDRLLEKFLRGFRGCYDVSGTHPMSIRRLADSVYQLVNPDCKLIVKLGEPGEHIDNIVHGDEGCYEKLPDNQKTQNFINWKPKTSIRQGLMYMAGN